jgi:hypothetical protein
MAIAAAPACMAGTGESDEEPIPDEIVEDIEEVSSEPQLYCNPTVFHETNSVAEPCGGCGADKKRIRYSTYSCMLFDCGHPTECCKQCTLLNKGSYCTYC